MPQMQPSALLQALINRIGGRLIVRPRQSKEGFGWSTATSHNMIARGELPPLRHFGGKLTGWFVPELIDRLARLVAGCDECLFTPKATPADARTPRTRPVGDGS